MIRFTNGHHSSCRIDIALKRFSRKLHNKNGQAYDNMRHDNFDRIDVEYTWQYEEC